MSAQVTARARSDCPRLVIPSAPQVGEGIVELIVRAASENSYDGPLDVLRALGVRKFFTGDLGRTSPYERQRIAALFGDFADSVLEDAIWPTPVKDRPGWISFFGTALRSVHLAWTRFRVAPRSLRLSSYLRTIWRLKVLPFDPESRERLLDACPVCKAPFTFTRTLGVSHCPCCAKLDDEGFVRGGVDLADYPQRIVHVRDEAALDYFTGLIDPSPVLRARISESAAPVLSKLDRGDLFEGGIAIICAVTTPSDFRGRTLNRPFVAKDYKRFTPDLLARVGRALIDWPETIQAIAEEIRADAPRRAGFFGIHKELGPLLSVTMDPHVHPDFRKLLRQELDANMESSASRLPTVRRAENRHRDDLVTTQAAATLVGRTRKFVATQIATSPDFTVIRTAGGKGPTLLKASELERAFALKDKLRPSTNAAVRLGIPRSAVADLAEEGLILRERGPIVALSSGKAYYHSDSLEALIHRVMNTARPEEPPKCAIRITVGINRLGGELNARWGAIFKAILAGELPVWQIRGRLSAVMTSLAVEHISRLANYVHDKRDVHLVQSEVALLAGENHNTITLAIQYGLLSDKPTIDEARRFAELYISTPAIQAALGDSGCDIDIYSLRKALAQRGVLPALELPGRERFLWFRQSIDFDWLRTAFDEHEPPMPSLLSDAQWVKLQPLLSSLIRSRGACDQENRRDLENMLAVLRSGRTWRSFGQVHGRLGHLRRRFQIWIEDGTWDRILRELVSLNLADWPHPKTEDGHRQLKTGSGLARCLLVERATLLKSNSRSHFKPIADVLASAQSEGTLIDPGASLE